jgi:hypothetical protein
MGEHDLGKACFVPLWLPHYWGLGGRRVNLSQIPPLGLTNKQATGYTLAVPALAKGKFSIYQVFKFNGRSQQMKMYLTITPNGFAINARGTSRRTGSALSAVPHCSQPPGRKRRF